MAVGISITPLAMAAALLLLSTARARTNGVAFVSGWLVGLGVLSVLALLVFNSANVGATRVTPAWASWLKVLLGLSLLALAWHTLRHPRVAHRAAVMPRWAGKAEEIKPPLALGVGALLAAARPKNILLVIAGVLVIAEASLPVGDESLAFVVFILVATIGVAVPVVIYFVMGQRGPAVLAQLEQWLRLHTGTVMAWVCLVIGVDLVVQGAVELIS